MTSEDRVGVDREGVRAVLAAAGIDPGRLNAYEELAEGTFNSVYRVRMAGGTDLVLKVAPDLSTPRMTYEYGITRTEELFYRTVPDRLPVPEVVHADFGHEVVGSDLLLMTRLPGQTLYSRRRRTGKTEWDGLRAELGGLVADLHQITGDAFGYPQAGLAPNWRTAFLSMVDAVLADARRFAAPLPAPVDRVSDLVRAQAHLLDDVHTPVLVHFDLWAGNILTDDTRHGPVITGLVDGERAFWGDPLAEMVSLALFGDIADDPAFLEGYRAAGGVMDLDTRTRRRLALYRCYLYLVMLVEAVPRGASGPEHEYVAGLVRQELLASLGALAGEAGGGAR
ncbi:phosphotransferase family protein [Nocardiopsis sp. NPDC058631]|uniref:phosphotransferase family protein n=1 Tax=Nocardiopsis sp. NPDC058631 TaxID=3346566 RepID=UPI0036462AD2